MPSRVPGARSWSAPCPFPVRSRSAPGSLPVRSRFAAGWASQIFDYVVDALFWLDLAVGARTSYRVENELVLEPKQVMRQ
jgi:hypothetical protein